MFCEKNKLQAITNFCSTDNTRMALKNVRFENGDAIATNGNIMAITTFQQIEVIGVDPPVKSEEKPFNVSANAISKACKNLSKKGMMLHEKGVFVSENVASSYSDSLNCATYKDEVTQDYPNFKTVIPAKLPEDIVISLGREPLATLCETMKLCGLKSVTLRIPPMGSKGHVCGAVSFSMGESQDDQITGIVMPYTTPVEKSNMEHIQIMQSDVEDMLALLLELAPDNELVQSFAYVYPQFVKTVPLAA